MRRFDTALIFDVLTIYDDAKEIFENFTLVAVTYGTNGLLE